VEPSEGTRALLIWPFRVCFGPLAQVETRSRTEKKELKKRCSKEKAWKLRYFLFVYGKEFLAFFIFLTNFLLIYIRFALFLSLQQEIYPKEEKSVKQRIYVVWF
jgi:hypothetical protein